jgi:hypothetical protein
MKILCLLAITALVLLASPAFGGLRTPGEYTGIVIFDHWDTCYLYSGLSLMYIAESEKEILRPYEGKAISIDAKIVDQPINPGDGLIKKFQLIGEEPVKPNRLESAGLKLTTTERTGAGDKWPSFEIALENQSIKSIVIDPFEIAPTVFGLREKADYFSPSDGLSDAKITRRDFGSMVGWGLGIASTPPPPIPDGFQESDSQKSSVVQHFSVDLMDADSLPRSFELGPGQKRAFTVEIQAPSGEYQLLFGYSSRAVSNKVRFFVVDNLFSNTAEKNQIDNIFSAENSVPSLFVSYSNNLVQPGESYENTN